MRYRFRKFVVQVVLDEMDDEGETTGEASARPLEFFATKQLAEFAREFPKHLEELNGGDGD